MQNLAVERKIVDPQVAGIGGSADLDPDGITLAELRAAVIEAQAKAALSNEPSGSHALEIDHRTAERRRHDVDGHFRPAVWKQAPGELDEFGFLPGIGHGTGYARGALRGNLAPQRCAVDLRQFLIQLFDRGFGCRLLRAWHARRRWDPRQSG